MSEELNCPFCGSDEEFKYNDYTKVMRAWECGQCAGMGEYPILTDPPTADQWQKIETAPKDGTHIQGLIPECAEPRQTMAWCEHNNMWLLNYTTYDDWLIGADSPTHWRPLPKPPTGDKPD